MANSRVLLAVLGTDGTVGGVGGSPLHVSVTGVAGVSSWDGRTGVVTPSSGDYTVGQVTGAAPLANPTFTGSVVVPSQSALNNSTLAANTAYTDAAVLVEKNRAVAAEAGYAPLAGDANFTSTVEVPTIANANDSSGSAASTAFVQAAIAAGGGGGGGGSVNNLGNIGNFGATQTVDLGGSLNTQIQGNLNVSNVTTLQGVAAGAQIEFVLTTLGAFNFSVSNGGSAALIAVPQITGSTFVVTVGTVDGTTLYIQGPPDVEYLISATNAAWPIPANLDAAEITCIGGYGSGAGGTGAPTGIAQAGSSGGGCPVPSTRAVQFGADTTLNIQVGAGGAGVTGATNGTGPNGNYGGNTTVTSTGGISLRSYGGGKGIAPVTGTTGPQLGVWGMQALNGFTNSNPGVGTGGLAASPGSPPFDVLAGGGGGGGNANGTLGGLGGGAGAVDTFGAAGTSGTSGTAAGGNGTSGAGGSGGGGGGCLGSKGGNSLAGGNGSVIIKATGGGTPIATITNQPLIWDGRPGIGAGSTVVYSGVGQGSLTNYSNIEGGTANPLYTVTPRVTVVPAVTGVGGNNKTGNCIRLITYDADAASVKPTGSSANPASAADSPGLLTITSNSNTYIGWSTFFCGSNSRGDNHLPVIFGAAQFLQFMEVYGPPFAGSPPWSMCVLSLDGGSTNSLIMPSQTSGFPNFWHSTSSLTYEAWYDFVIHIGFSTTAATTGAPHTGGFLELWVNNVAQTFSTSANWQTANGNGDGANTTLLIPTANSTNWNGSSANTLDFDNYRRGSVKPDGTPQSPPGLQTGPGVDPITIYNWGPRLGSTKASVQG